ncbi:MAG: ATPase, partial [Clostridia bacterium]|nr:ATPase [Clostridia bacterium]
KNEDNTFFYVGWITADAQEEFENKVKKLKGLTADFEDPTPSMVERVPIKLKNNALFRPFSYFVEMFGLPSYNELDPTPLFAVTYALMFGLMFADLGQGVVVIIIGILMHKIKKMELGKILIRCGIFSCIFGAVFGSVFGVEDLLDGFYQKIGLTMLPIKVFDNTTSILILAISAGVLLMLLIMLINTVNCFRLKRFADAIFGANGIAGLLVYTSMVYLATNFMANAEVKAYLAVVPSKLPVILLVVGIILMFLHEFVAEKMEDKNYKPQIGNYILSNFIELFESILSFFSNTVSYLRLGAFVLVHAGMMMVVTTLAGDKFGVTYIIVMVLGNALVIALEALLTGIQSLRLEFYEMFSRYYAGQGKAFEPVNINELEQ